MCCYLAYNSCSISNFKIKCINVCVIHIQPYIADFICAYHSRACLRGFKGYKNNFKKAWILRFWHKSERETVTKTRQHIPYCQDNSVHWLHNWGSLLSTSWMSSCCHNIQAACGAHPTGTRAKVVWLCNWPLLSIQCSCPNQLYPQEHWTLSLPLPVELTFMKRS